MDETEKAEKKQFTLRKAGKQERRVFVFKTQIHFLRLLRSLRVKIVFFYSVHLLRQAPR